MNKVICDICGTTYPEAASQCPICGCAKPESSGAIYDDNYESESGSSYTYVKGGRFSNANVRKRNKAMAAAADVPRREVRNQDSRPAPARTKAQQTQNVRDHAKDEAQEPMPSNGGLIILLIILIAAIIAVSCYIYFSFFAPQPEAEQPAETTAAPVSTTVPTTTAAPEPTDIPCSEITVSETDIVLENVGSAWLLNVVAMPEDTTDIVTYASSDETVATVTDEGRITAVGAGSAVITVTCGDKVVECAVTCSIETEAPTEEPTEATTEATEPEDDWSLNRTDITFRNKGASWTLYSGSVSKNLIRFSSDDESIATFKNGVVKAIGNGTTVVRAEYNGVKYECTIRVKIAETSEDGSASSGDNAVG